MHVRHTPLDMPPQPSSHNVKRQAIISFVNNESQGITVFSSKPIQSTTSVGSTALTTVVSPNEPTATSSKTIATSHPSTASSKPTSGPSTSITPTERTPFISQSYPSLSSASTSSSNAVAASTDTQSDGIPSSTMGAVVAVLVILIAALVAFIFVRRRQKKAKATNNSMARFSAGSRPGSTPTRFAYTGSTLTAAAHASIVAAGTAPETPEPMSAILVTTSEKEYAPPKQPSEQPPQQQPSPLTTQLHINSLEFWQQRPLGTFVVVSTYLPILNDELEVQRGDQVQVFVEYDDGWCMGINLTRGHIHGVFPKCCIQPESSAVNDAKTLHPVTLPRPHSISEEQFSKRHSSLYSAPHYLFTSFRP